MHFASLSTFIWLDWFLILNPSQLQRSYHTLSGCGSTNAEYFIHPITGNYRVNMHSKFKSTQNDQVRGESLIHHCVPDSCCTSLEPFRQFGPPLHINPPSQSHTLSSLETRVCGLRAVSVTSCSEYCRCETGRWGSLRISCSKDSRASR